VLQVTFRRHASFGIQSFVIANAAKARHRFANCSIEAVMFSHPNRLLRLHPLQELTHSVGSACSCAMLTGLPNSDEGSVTRNRGRSVAEHERATDQGPDCDSHCAAGASFEQKDRLLCKHAS
jgi:hypothetical protein